MIQYNRKGDVIIHGSLGEGSWVVMNAGYETLPGSHNDPDMVVYFIELRRLRIRDLTVSLHGNAKRHAQNCYSYRGSLPYMPAYMRVKLNRILCEKTE